MHGGLDFLTVGFVTVIYCIVCPFAYLSATNCTVGLEKLIVAQVVKKIPHV
jgi:hypothetical protein